MATIETATGGVPATTDDQGRPGNVVDLRDHRLQRRDSASAPADAGAPHRLARPSSRTPTAAGLAHRARMLEHLRSCERAASR